MVVSIANIPPQDQVRERRAELWEAVGELWDAFFGVLKSRRLHRAILNSLVIATFAAVTWFLSIPAYGAFYHFHLPDQVVEVPVYLQYG
jgi:ABC-type sulfate transport system permease component